VYIVKESFAPFLRGVDRRRSLFALVCIVGLLAWTVPITDTLWFGQINLILAALVLTDCLRARKQRGVLVGLATALKITPGLFIVYFLVTKQTRAAIRSIVTVAVCWGGAAIILPAATREYWLHTAFKIGRPGPPAFFSNQTMNGLVHRLNGPGWIWIPLGLVVTAVGVWRARAAHRSGNVVGAVVLVGLTTLLVAPISWLATAVWIAPAIGLILGHGTQRRRLVAAWTVLILLWARLPMLGDKVTRVYSTPFIGTALQDSYVILLAVLILWLPLTDPEAEPTDSRYLTETTNSNRLEPLDVTTKVVGRG
jgi:alpha-1,2-mannosyltransferase